MRARYRDHEKWKLLKNLIGKSIIKKKSRNVEIVEKSHGKINHQKKSRKVEIVEKSHRKTNRQKKKKNHSLNFFIISRLHR